MCYPIPAPSSAHNQVVTTEYSPFGETTAQSGDLADRFTHRFSTKPFDAETGLSKYQQRDYIPPLGCWANRDPIKEASFSLWNKKYKDYVPSEQNEYLFCLNAPLITIDPDGAMAQPLIDRRHPPKGKRLITVSKNTILIMYGHHFQNPKHSRHGEGFENIWNIVSKNDRDKGCAYAAVVTCMAAAVPNEIPLPGYSPVSAGSELDIDDPSAETDMGRELTKAKMAADSEAKNMCKKCCAKKIHVEVDSYGLNFLEYFKYPTLMSWDVSCK